MKAEGREIGVMVSLGQWLKDKKRPLWGGRGYGSNPDPQGVGMHKKSEGPDLGIITGCAQWGSLRSPQKDPRRQ